MKVYRRFNLVLENIRMILGIIDDGWELLCYCNTQEDADQAIADDRAKSILYEYKVEE